MRNLRRFLRSVFGSLGIWTAILFVVWLIWHPVTFTDADCAWAMFVSCFIYIVILEEGSDANSH